MVKSIVTVIISFSIIFAGAFAEQRNINKSFNELKTIAEITQKKVQEKNVTTDDVLVLQNKWIKKKKTLHVWIPHNEIKEIELWISECVMCVKNEKYPDASEKLEVVIELCEQIPKSFSVSWQNIL